MKTNAIFIVGGAGLIGHALIKHLSFVGYNVVVGDLKFGCINPSENIFPLALNVDDEQSIDNAIEYIRREKFNLSSVINCVYPRTPNYGKKADEISLSDFQENVSLHLGGYFSVSQKFGRYFAQNGGGNIINFSSIYGSVMPRFELYEGTNMTMPVEYAAAKSGILQMTKYFAKLYKKNAVRYNCVSPGGVFDGQSQTFIDRYNKYCGSLGMLAPEDLCGVVEFLLSDNARYITGQEIIIDDGFSL
jgi:NAD(P)-dependent dehydrogenase (short-subunit alcohol dehydrogenase family)